MHYILGELSIDENAFELRRRDEAVPVEPRVLEFILYLIRNRERLVTRKELLDQLWKESCVVESVVSRCACVARRTLGDSSLIATVYGRGYRWRAPQMHIVAASNPNIRIS